jgi:prepilin-type N-terminal cleavage/methylation domain-containing protein
MRSRTNGFTFIELMIAVTIFAMIAVTIYSTLHVGIQVWKTAGSAEDTYQRSRLMLGAFDLDVRNAVAYSPVHPSGDAGHLSFMSISASPSSEKELTLIAYRFDRAKGTLVRIRSGAEGAFKEENGVPTHLLSGLKECVFSYCYPVSSSGGVEWRQVWEREDGIPYGVRAVLRFRGGDTGTVFEKYAYMPLGSMADAQKAPAQ